jgi:3-hydroxyisobutyrate dehydrogenase-like beta-hydroxyacid dehydrogenase
MAAETIGFVGTGRMGGPMAGRLLDAGYSLCIYDSQAEATKALVARAKMALLAEQRGDAAQALQKVSAQP